MGQAGNTYRTELWASSVVCVPWTDRTSVGKPFHCGAAYTIISRRQKYARKGRGRRAKGGDTTFAPASGDGSKLSPPHLFLRNATGSVPLTVSAWPGYPVSGRGWRRSQLRASLNVTVLRCAQVLRFEASPAAFGDSTVFSASVSGTAPLSVRAVFHDGAQKRWTTRRNTGTIRFSHLYARTGSFHVTLSCTNRAGSATRFAVAVVEEPAFGLRMMVRKPASFPLLPLGDTVELEAELISGTGLTFHWKVADSNSTYVLTTEETRGRSSIVRHRFSAPGTYNVSVSVSNALFSRSGANLVGHLEQPLRVVEAIDGLVTDVIGSPYVILRQPCGNSSASKSEEAASASTTPSSNRSTGRRRRTVDSCNGKCKPVEIRSPEIMLSRHADDSRTERLATYQHQSVTLTSAIYEKKGDSQSPEAPLLRSEEVQRGLDTTATSMPCLLLRVRKPRRAIRRTTRQSDDADRQSTTTREALLTQSPVSRVPPSPTQKQPLESMPELQQQPHECRPGGVQFHAHVARGSDVVFDFHFGDGRSRRVEASTRSASRGVGSMTQPTASAVVNHRYERGGRFLVSVTASNPLGSVTRLIDRTVYVGSPAEGLTLEPASDYAVVVAGRVGSFRAALRRGEDVIVAWELRSATAPAGQLRARHTGMRFEHLFDSPGTYHLVAEASNPITEGLRLPRPRTEVKIFVQEMLREVSLCVWPPGAGETCAPAHLTLPSEKRFLLRAFATPATETMLRFRWSLTPQQEQYVTDAAVVNLRPTRPGTYVIRVTCQNHVSSAMSPELALRLAERVTNLHGIVVLGPVLVSRPTRLRAIHTTGSNLTFVWNFGDGSAPAVVTDNPEVSHRFTRVREYWVKVVAYNVFSRAEFETNVFAMLQPCNKPEIRINRHTKVRFDEVVFVEATVSTWCPISTKVRYSWTVLNATRSHVVLEQHGSGALSRKDLVLPAGTLPVGRYLIALKARMVPTFVYAVENVTLTVVPSPVSFSIAGGLVANHWPVRGRHPRDRALPAAPYRLQDHLEVRGFQRQPCRMFHATLPIITGQAKHQHSAFPHFFAEP
ncbi:hypothetical protein MRX96_001895 [Rhipicephalus microplus]